jgi:hypothetical protein
MESVREKKLCEKRRSRAKDENQQQRGAVGQTDGANLKSDTYFLLTGPLAIFLLQQRQETEFSYFATVEK